MKTDNTMTTDSIYQKYLLNPLGLDHDNAFVFWMILLFASILSGGLYYFHGNVPLVVGIMYLTFLLFLSIFRPDYSLYLLMSSVIIFDQFPIPGFPSFTHDVSFFSNLKEISYVPFFEAGMISPFEIHILFLCTGLMLQISIRKNFTLKPIAVWGSFLIFFGSLAIAFMNGMRNGGDYLVALWEVRALFYFCVMYLVVPQILESKKQVIILFWLFIISITFKALQGVIRFIDLGFTTGGYAVLTNHEDPVFMVTLAILLIGLFLFKTGKKQRAWILGFLVVLLLGFYVAQRRATYASMLVSLAAIIVLLPSLKRVQFMKFLLPVLAVVILYGAVFWNDTGTLGRPVQMIRSGFETPDKTTNFDDYSSNLYRNNENYNLAQTVVNNPVLGTGFGVKYEQPIPLVEIRFTLRDYIPHNQIYWILVKTGPFGFLAFWFFFNCYVARGTHVFMRARDPYLKAITLVIVVAVINQLVVSFFDLQLTYYRSMLYLGCLMGLLPVIIHLENEQEGKHKSKSGGSDG